MIHTEKEYRRSLTTLEKSREKLEDQKKALKAKGLSPEQIKRVLDPTRAFLHNIEADVHWYERAKKGHVPMDESLETIGRLLVALRISKGMTQADLAKALHITQGQVSEDEQDEYHGISVDRARKILAVFGVQGRIHFARTTSRKAA